jgi:hypothetical protein
MGYSVTRPKFYQRLVLADQDSAQIDRQIPVGIYNFCYSLSL